VPERRQLYPGLSAADNILLGCYCWTSSIRKARNSGPFGRALELFPEIGPHLKQPAGTLSGGQQQMVAIMRGLASDPKILAVDEPRKVGPSHHQVTYQRSSRYLSVSDIQVAYLHPPTPNPRSTPAVSTVLRAEALRTD
jgi:ABC-type sugar transport system ATPase subunit